MMKRILTLSVVLGSLFFGSAHVYAQDAATYTQSKEKLQLITPDSALKMLEEGNARFVSGNMKNRDFLQQAKLTHQGQHAFAFVLSCIDSRGSAELIFDQGLGDIYSGRVAGNVVDTDQLGGMEFATQVMGAHIIVVMGHTACGAVKGACTETKLGNLTALLDKIHPAAQTVEKDLHSDSLNCDDGKVVNAIAKQNVLNMMQQIKEKSPIIKKLIENKQVMIVGAMHDLSTGKVTFFK